MTGKDYIIINGVSSHTVGLYVDTPPMPSHVTQNYETIQIPGRDEGIIYKQTIREDEPVTINAYLFDNTAYEPQALYSFLSAAKTLTTSKSDNYYRKVKRLESITPTYQGHGKQFLAITFICSPYKYLVDNDAVTLRGSDTLIENDCAEICEPVFTLKGSGTIQLTVNGETLAIPNVSGYCTVDAEKLLVYKDNAIIAGTRGKIPKFNIGTNRVQTNASPGSAVVLNRRWI